MAADKGLLEFDGVHWKRLKGSDGITRSVYVANDATIYTGSDRDFGVWNSTATQGLNYTSLYQFRDEFPSSNEEFWFICSKNGYVVFVSYENVYLLKNQVITRIPVPHPVGGFYSDGNNLYVTGGQVLYKLDGPQLIKVAQSNKKQRLELKGVYSLDGELVLVTKSEGLFQVKKGAIEPLNTSLSEELKRAELFSFRAVQDKYLAFGTISEGLLITSLDGTVIHRINKSNGLVNNTILSMHYDQSGKLWLGMDYGISVVDLASPFTYFYDNIGSFGTGYTAALHKGVFYLGTNQGLYSTPWDQLHNRTGKHTLKMVPGTSGQVWNLSVFDGQVWIGHDRGLFSIGNEGLKRRAPVAGVWNLVPFKGRLLAGTYNGIAILEREKGEFRYSRNMPEILGSCNQIFAEGDSVIWVNIPTFGVVRSTLDNQLNPVRRTVFKPHQFEGNEPVLRQELGKLIVQLGTSRYQWSAASNAFDKDVITTLVSETKALLPGTFEPVQLDDRFWFYPVFNGFSLRDGLLDSNIVTPYPAPIVRLAQVFNNNNRKAISAGEYVSYAFNNIHLAVIVPNAMDLLYQFRGDKTSGWSVPKATGEIEFVGLPSGTNTIYARAITPAGVALGEVQFSFRIAPPWYRTWYSMLSIALLFGIVIYYLIVRLRLFIQQKEREFKAEQQLRMQEQEERHKQLLLEIEQKNLQDAYDQIKNQLKYKTMELARKARENEIKNQLLDTIKEKFEQLKQHPESLKTRASEIQRLLDTYISQKDETFEIQMNELHQDFFEKLKKHTPGLSPHDLKLCAYIKIGFNSKEIADLLNIQPSSVYITRSRLRKKLNLDSDDDLHGFLNGL
jgi:DNA-binding CsgD family transcriptional regulator